MTRFPIDGTGRLSSEREHPTTVLTGPAGGDLAGSYPNPTVAVVDAVRVRLDSLHASPRSVTDWGTIINAYVTRNAITNTVLVAGPFAYPFTTPLSFDNTQGVTIVGVSGSQWVQNQWLGLPLASYLLYKGSGATDAITYANSTALTFQDIGIYYDNSGGSFTGRLISGYHSTIPGGVAATPTFRRCHIGSLGNSAQTALACVALDSGILTLITESTLFGAQYAVLGNETARSNLTNVAQIEFTTFSNCSVAFIANIGLDWEIGGSNVFEIGNTPAIIDYTVAPPAGSLFEFHHNSSYDINIGNNGPMIKLPAAVVWRATFNHNDIANRVGPLFSLLGGGSVVISENTQLGAADGGAIVDLGDTGAGAVPKNLAKITDNWWTTPSGAVVLNQAGHFNLQIERNGIGGASQLDIRTIRGHERTGFSQAATHEAFPAISNLSGHVTFSEIENTDIGGIIAFTVDGTCPADTALVQVTFGTPFVNSPGWLSGDANAHVPIVHLTPMELATRTTDGGRSAAALAYVSAPLLTGFAIGLHVPPAGGGTVWYAYRVLGM